MLHGLPYSSDDLAHTRFASSPLGHLVHGVHNGPCSRRSVARERWWRWARRHVPEAALPLVELINARASALPEFLLPEPLADAPTAEASLASELERLRATPPDLIRAELAPSVGRGTAAAERLVRDLQDGSSRALRRVTDSASLLFTACLADDWPDIRNRLRADLAYRAEVMLSQGPGAVFHTLRPEVRWHRDRLWFTSGSRLSGGTQGRGLVLMPCAFGRDSVHPAIGPHRAPSLIYSARGEAAAVPDYAARDMLPELIGAGRARALRAIDDGCSTTLLARRLSVAPPTASVQARLLRATGLITTERDGRHVRHQLTPLGADLLAANPARPW